MKWYNRPVAGHNGSEITLLLSGSDKEGWTAEAVIMGPDNESVTLDPTAVFPTKKQAGQAAFDVACKYVERPRNRLAKRA